MKSTLTLEKQQLVVPVPLTLWLTEEEELALDTLVEAHFADEPSQVRRERFLFDMLQYHVHGDRFQLTHVVDCPEGTWYAAACLKLRRGPLY